MMRVIPNILIATALTASLAFIAGRPQGRSRLSPDCQVP